MPLTSVQKVEQRLGLTPFLFNISTGNPTADQAALDALVTDAILDADAEMQFRLTVNNYNPADVNAQRMQATAQCYLAADYLLLVLRAQKTYGTHAPFLSEEGSAYEQLEAMGLREIAEGLLSPWISIAEREPGKGFARPVCLTGDSEGERISTEERDLERLLDDARSFREPTYATVRS